MNITEYNIPTIFQEAVSRPDAAMWIKAINKELDAHQRNKTWEIVPKMASHKTIDSKWVFKVSQNMAGEITHYKARLCARGFLQ